MEHDCAGGPCAEGKAAASSGYPSMSLAEAVAACTHSLNGHKFCDGEKHVAASTDPQVRLKCAIFTLYLLLYLACFLTWILPLHDQ